MHLPSDFTAQIEDLLLDASSAFFRSLEEVSPTSIRMNISKVKEKQQLDPVLWCEAGYYLPERPFFTSDPLFHAGCYYPQEASSMFVEQAIKQHANGGDIRILDLCAAPGGKSTHLLSLISDKSLLVSNEVIRSRANILSENIIKTGYSNAIVTNNDPSDIGRKLKGFFDVILVDAPCSGEGMFRKDATAIDEWSAANVKLCAGRQQRILADVWDALKPGGILIYSTCTYNLEEDEKNVGWVCTELGAETLNISIDKDWNIITSLVRDVKAYRFMPHQTKGEGLFLAVLRKTDSDSEKHFHSRISKSRNKEQKPVKIPIGMSDCIIDADRYTFALDKDYWYAFPSAYREDIELIKTNLRTISYGICLGEFKGKDFIPSHSLAMSNNLNRRQFESLDISWEMAIAYLRKEAVTLDSSVSKGYVLLTFRGVPLGFVKNIGNRANNLYPQEWRIRTSHVALNSFQISI